MQVGVSLGRFYTPASSYRHPLRWDFHSRDRSPGRLCSRRGGFLRARPLRSGHTAYQTLASQTPDFCNRAANNAGPLSRPLPRAAAGGEQRAARGAGRAAGAGARLSGRRRRRRARACIPQKLPEPAGRRHPRLRPRPSPSKVTLD